MPRWSRHLAGGTTPPASTTSRSCAYCGCRPGVRLKAHPDTGLTACPEAACQAEYATDHGDETSPETHPALIEDTTMAAIEPRPAFNSADLHLVRGSAIMLERQRPDHHPARVVAETLNFLGLTIPGSDYREIEMAVTGARQARLEFEGPFVVVSNFADGRGAHLAPLAGQADLFTSPYGTRPNPRLFQTRSEALEALEGWRSLMAGREATASRAQVLALCTSARVMRALDAELLTD